ncbi:hypothetical protein Tco_0299082 [Tanacetum coccineum]
MCNVAREARKNIFLWRKIDNTSINNLNDVINLADRVSLPTKLLKVFDVLVQTTLYRWDKRKERDITLILLLSMADQESSEAQVAAYALAS